MNYPAIEYVFIHSFIFRTLDVVTREIQSVGHGAVAHIVGVEGDDADPRLVALPPHHDPHLGHGVHVHLVVLAPGYDVLPVGGPERVANCT